MAPMLFYDKLCLYAKNIEQSKHKHMIDNLTDVSKQVSYNVFHYNNGDIITVDEMDTKSRKIAIFDGFICEKKNKEIKKYKGWLDYFIRGRQKNCFVINLSFKGFYKTPKDIRLNCSHYAVYNFLISNERNTISRELGVTKAKSLAVISIRAITKQLILLTRSITQTL